jgi:hypothetical protein
MTVLTAQSSAFTVSSATSNVSALSFTGAGAVEPSTTSNVEYTPLTTQPVVAIMNTGGTVATTDSSTSVTLTCIAPSGCVLYGTTTVTDVNGLATFSNVYVNEATGTGGIVLQAVASGLTTTDSSAFAIP